MFRVTVAEAHGGATKGLNGAARGRRPGVLRQLLANHVGALGMSICVVVVLVAALAWWIAPHDPTQLAAGDPLSRPSANHWFGTDELGRDIFSRVAFGAQIALSVGLLSALIAVVGGVPLGLAAGYYGGWFDSVLMRLVDAWLAFPMMVLALGMTAALGPSLINVTIAVGFVNIPNFVRLARGQTLLLKQRQYIEAARSIAQRDSVILFRHLLPNMLPVLIVQASLTVAYAIMVESALSFLGVGVMPPTPSWGAMLSQSQAFLTLAPWMALFPGAAIFLLVMGLNLLGDGLRDVLDPRLRG